MRPGAASPTRSPSEPARADPRDRRTMTKPNVRYGNGVFRRRILLRSDAGLVRVELEDGNHGFRLRLQHDGHGVTGVDADTLRHPFGTCTEAVRPLREFVGHRLADGARVLRERLDPGAHCTHLFDMAMLAIAHASARPGGAGSSVDYEMAVHDEVAGLTQARIRRDGELVHVWQIQAHRIVAPAAHQGQPMMRGFHAWASAAFDATALEAAAALQRAYFVAQSRRFDFDPPDENPGSADGMPHGSCYSYNRGVVERAFRSHGTVRDFTHTPEKLLRFEPGAARSLHG